MDPTNIFLLTFLASFLGGGIISALINWAQVTRSEQKERQINFLDRQIRELYGPLHYFVLQAEKLFELNKKHHGAYKKEFVEKTYSKDPGTQKILEEEAAKTLGIANRYINHVEENNAKIKEVIDGNYSLIDPEDIEVFLLFFEHHIRLKTERSSKYELETPFRIYQHIGDISFLRPEFIKRIQEKFFGKKGRLERLLKNKFCCF